MRKIRKLFSVLTWRIAVITLEKTAEIFGGGEFKLFCRLMHRETFAQRKDSLLEDELLCILLGGDVVFFFE